MCRALLAGPATSILCPKGGRVGDMTNSIQGVFLTLLEAQRHPTRLGCWPGATQWWPSQGAPAQQPSWKELLTGRGVISNRVRWASSA